MIKISLLLNKIKFWKMTHKNMNKLMKIQIKM